MLRLVLLISAFLLPGWCHARIPADSLRREITMNPRKSGGIYYAYPEPCNEVFSIPPGFRPIAISHYGRHGSRWAIKEYQYPLVIGVLLHQQKTDNLTAQGQALLNDIMEIARHAKGHAGELAPLGERQHRGIAERMVARVPTLFSDSSSVCARSSVEPRCIVSMAAFSERLKEINPALRVSRSATPADMDFISWSSPEAKALGRNDSPCQMGLRTFHNSTVDSRSVINRIFINTDSVFPDLIEDFYGFDKTGISADKYLFHEWEFVKLIHDIAVTTQNVELEKDILGFFSSEELFSLWQSLNYNMYVRHANAPATGAAGMLAARSLLDDIISRADESLAGMAAPVQLRFGHDTALIRLLALMGIDGCSEQETDPSAFCEAWQDFNVSPMAANLQLIFLAPDSMSASHTPSDDQILVAILHNEHTATLPLSQITPGYYRWSDLKSFWSKP